jgi:uncharacterized protein (TIGR02117 family)
MCRFYGIRAAGLLVISAVLLAAACQSPAVVSAPSEAAPGEAQITVYVTSNGWHSAIVVPRAALPPGAIPEAADFPGAAYLSLGWGDAEYFPVREPTIGMKLRAALQPTPAVFHMAGLPFHPQDVFPADEVVELKTTAQGFAALIAYLDATFDRDGAERAQSSEPGLYRFSLFYPAKGKFHLFNTCNTWTARGLKAGGWPIRVSGTVTAEELMAQVRPLAARQDPKAPAGQSEPEED